MHFKSTKGLILCYFDVYFAILRRTTVIIIDY